MEVKRVRYAAGRDAVFFDGKQLRVVVDDLGGMIPELSFPYRGGWFNTHWNPHFRSNSGIVYDPEKHEDFWPVRLLYNLAGSFPCFPSFGGGCTAYDAEMDPHGLTANGTWTVDTWGVLDQRIGYSRSTLTPDASNPSIPLSYTKYDIVLNDHPVHYVFMKIRNNGDREYRINAAWHNTLGPPFLSPGCRIDLPGRMFATPPSPSEFDDTTRLQTGVEFEGLENAPLVDGGTADLHRVPGMIGYTDFVTGPVPESEDIGWSSVVNPAVGALYLAYFRGPASVSDDEIGIRFNDLWMQYGGRRYTPWASFEGGSDLTYCLGTENATGAFANGLKYSLDHEELLGTPTTVSIAPGEEKVHRYGTLAVPFTDGELDDGVGNVEEEGERLRIHGNEGSGVITVEADADLGEIAVIAQAIDAMA